MRSLLVFLAGFCGLAHATLGESISTIENDRLALKAAPALAKRADQYQTRELKSRGNTVTEYIAPNGSVFAISWRGVASPNMSQLLGAYYREYLVGNAAVPRNPHARRPATVKTSNLVIRRTGRMGLAYLPRLVPEAVNVEELP